jgi:hypothetical protein
MNLRADLQQWLIDATPEATDDTARFAVTLTFDINRMYALTPSGVLKADDKIAWAKRAFAKFRRRLDHAILGNAASRYNRELVYIPMIEGQGAKQQLHYHCVIVTPARVTTHQLAAETKRAWMQTGVGGHQIDVQPMYDRGWLSYIAKEAWTVKRETVDFDNVRLGASPQRC